MMVIKTFEGADAGVRGLDVEFGQSAAHYPVARFGDTVLAMLPLPRQEHTCLGVNARTVTEPLNTLSRKDFSAWHDIEFVDEAAFRAHVYEMAQHAKELAALARVQEQAQTPDGETEIRTVYGDGIVSVETETEFGFELSERRNAEVDEDFRSDSGLYQGDEAKIVAFTFPDLFTAHERKCADKVIRDDWPDQWERIVGGTLSVEESKGKARRQFRQQHADDFVAVQATQSHYAEGMTEVIAVLGGRQFDGVVERRFLVPTEEFKTRGRFGFVIDEARHMAYDGPTSIGVLAEWEKRLFG